MRDYGVDIPLDFGSPVYIRSSQDHPASPLLISQLPPFCHHPHTTSPCPGKVGRASVSCRGPSSLERPPPSFLPAHQPTFSTRLPSRDIPPAPGKWGEEGLGLPLPHAHVSATIQPPLDHQPPSLFPRLPPRDIPSCPGKWGEQVSAAVAPRPGKTNAPHTSQPSSLPCRPPSPLPAIIQPPLHPTPPTRHPPAPECGPSKWSALPQSNLPWRD